MKPPIMVIAGPTASGKTASAIAIAQAIGGEIIGADSVQVYRGFDIGSAKPTPQEQAQARHHMVDVLDPPDFIDAMVYAEMADKAIANVVSRGHKPIIVGGTGLWIRALVRGLLDVPPPDPKIRARLEAQADKEGSQALHKHLAQVDPIAADQIHPNDAIRVVRALEIFEMTGKPVGELRAQHALGAQRYPTLFAVLELDMEKLTERIELRMAQMLELGFLDEVRDLLKRWPRTSRAFGSVGYREAVEHLEDGLELDEMKRRMRKSTRIYGRRQRTWFRNEPGVHWRTDASGLTSPEALERIALHFS